LSKKPSVQPWMPEAYEEADVMACKAVAAGTANEGQQKRFMQFVINNVCRTYDLSYRPGDDGSRDTAFAEGKRFVGLQLVKFIKIPWPVK
jgi:hypothetical protein